MKKFLFVLLILAVSISAFAKKNVILMIGDGMGINSVNMGQYYEGKVYPFTRWDTKLFATTYSASCTEGYNPEKAWTDPEKTIPNLKWLGSCTDSAAAATALNSGIKTQNGRVNFSPDGKTAYVPFGQMMKSMGYAVGSITTVTWNDATPSGPFGHTPNRGDIVVATDMLTHPIDVLGGCGNPYYDGNGIERAKINKKPSYGHFANEQLWKGLEDGSLGIKLCNGTDAIKAVAKEKHPQGPYYFALPNQGDLPYMKLGDLSKEQYKDCPEDIITLREMSMAALNVLKENPKGFYLMIEGGAIDHGNHGNNWKHTTCQMASFADAIEGVCQWVEKNSSWDETVVIVTADHQTGGIINEDGTYHIANMGKVKQPKMKYTTGGHTNLPVPVFVKGAYADHIWDFVQGTDPVFGKYIDNTNIPQFFAKYIGIIDFPIYVRGSISLPDMIKNDLKSGDTVEVALDKEWAFKEDKAKAGFGAGWYKDYNVFANASKLNVNQIWDEQGYKIEMGEGWYYDKITVPATDKKYNYLMFGGIDEEGWIYINGKEVVDHTRKATGDSLDVLYCEPVFVDLKPYEGQTIDVVVRVSNDLKAGGIYIQPRILQSNRDYNNL